MFDSTPPNLPVEPAQQPTPLVPMTPSPSPSPVAPPSMPPLAPKIMTTGGKKEPEDIFSGLEAGGPSVNTPPSAPYVPAPRGFPWRMVAIIIVSLALLGSIGGAIYVYLTTYAPSASKPAPVKPPVDTQIPQVPKPIETPPPAAIPVQPVVEPTTTMPVTTAPTGVPLPVTSTAPSLIPPAVIIGEGKDSDADQLTDVEEPYYSADMVKADTDGDGYPDGSEVRNTFDPSKKGMSLSVAAFMSKPAWHGWTFLLPKPWSIVSDQTDATKASISTGSATRFALQWFTKPSTQTIDQWLASKQITAPVTLLTKSGTSAHQSGDGLTTYLANGDSVLRVAYDLNGETSYEYRTSYILIVNAVAPAAKK